ncbi:hypothetical protein V6N13_038500 [Hibiscus sabdariffa]
MVDEFGMWDWSRISPFIPVPVARKIAATKPPSPSLGPDVPGWRWESNRVFSMSSVYERGLVRTLTIRSVGGAICGLLMDVVER